MLAQEEEIILVTGYKRHFIHNITQRQSIGNFIKALKTSALNVTGNCSLKAYPNADDACGAERWVNSP